MTDSEDYFTTNGGRQSIENRDVDMAKPLLTTMALDFCFLGGLDFASSYSIWPLDFPPSDSRTAWLTLPPAPLGLQEGSGLQLFCFAEYTFGFRDSDEKEIDLLV